MFGSAFWGGLIEWIRDELGGLGTVSAADLALISLTDDPAAAADIVIGAYESADAEAPTERGEAADEHEPLGHGALGTLEQ